MYYCATDAIVETIANCPTPHAFTLLVEKLSDNDSIQTFKTWCDSNGYNATVFVRSGYPNWGNGWRQLTTATPPQVFDLPLAEGWTGLAKYYKTQENICFIELDILKNATIQNGEVLATLPEGFRPSYLRMHPAIVYSPHSSTTISVSPTGSVLFGDMSGSPSARNIYATLVFVAAS